MHKKRKQNDALSFQRRPACVSRGKCHFGKGPTSPLAAQTGDYSFQFIPRTHTNVRAGSEHLDLIKVKQILFEPARLCGQGRKGINKSEKQFHTYRSS